MDPGLVRVTRWIRNVRATLRTLLRLEAGERVLNILTYGSLMPLRYWDPLRGDPRFEKIVASLAPKD
jgi:hypothetical protein